MLSEFDTPSRYFFDDVSESEVSRYIIGYLSALIVRLTLLYRLNTQYPFYKSIFGHSQVIPPEIDITNVSRVIDVGTGTGVWALDFASQPEVQRRNIQIFACDIDDTKFLQGNKLAEKHISFFQQDVTKPFPDELLGTFDLVNVLLLCCALTSQGWKMALQNLRSLLSE
jgi:SAM-dependent methyltransferase